MKIRKYLILLTCAFIIISLGSCSFIDKATKEIGNKVSSITKTSKTNKSSSDKDAEAAKSTAKQKTPKSKKQKGKDVSQEVVLPHDRQHIAAHKELRTYTPEEIAQGVVKGDWAIEQVNGRSAVGEKAPFLKFSPVEKRFYGNNGCNSITGSYTYNPADSTLRFENIVATMMLCSKEGITDYEINAALDATRNYTWTEKDGDYYLHLLDSSKREVMTLMHQNFDFLNGAWNVEAINDKPVSNPNVKLVIDVDENHIHGNTGCNILNGAMETDMDAANSISFNSIATTRMACPPGDNTETEFIVALEEASTAKPVSATEVILFNSMGNPVLKLVRQK